MDMDARKLRILRAIIDDYILTGVPVGSRTISKKYEMGLSSATIRNEMSDLEELGFLDQPHVFHVAGEGCLGAFDAALGKRFQKLILGTDVLLGNNVKDYALSSGFQFFFLQICSC